MSTVNRLTGAVTGWDTDQMVKDLIKLEQAKVDKVKQDKQVAQWQKDAYKEFSTLLRGLQSEYFDVLKPAQNLRSSAMYNLYSAAVTSGGSTSTKVSAITSADSVAGDITISQIGQLAGKDKWTSASEVKNLTENGFVAVTQLNTFIAQGNDEFKVTLDGVSKNIILAGSYTDAADVGTKLQAQINAAFGTGKVTVGVDGSNALTFVSSGHSLKFSTVDPLVLSTMGLYDGATNTLENDQTLQAAFGVAATDLDFSINGVTSASLGITETTTVAELMNKINNSSAGVTLRYSAISNKMTLESNSEGSINDITLTDTSGFFAGKLKVDGTVRTHGQDAQLTINGVATTRSSNTFEVDGTTLTLKETHAAGTDIKIGVTGSSDSVVETIKGFVTKYNELLGKLGGAIGEKRYYDYRPLTDDVKADMSDTDIEAWETKAKSGLLRADPILLNIQSKLRRALSDSVDGVDLKLSDIGITTSSNYLENGKLILDEAKLKTALSQRPTEVVQLFSKQSDKSYSDESGKTERYSENGIANRINDLLNDNIRLSRNSTGSRGALIDKAGSELNSTDTSSYLAKKITGYDTRIATLLDLLTTKETKYYNQFSRMETALQKLNAQSSSLMSSMGNSNG